MMKESMRLFKHKEFGYLTKHGQSLSGIGIFELFINDSCPSDFLKYLNDPNEKGLGLDAIEVDWSREQNMAVITRSDEIFDDPKELEEELVMTFENFKKMIEDWAALYEKKVPNIYFVFEDDGSVTVKESLDK